MTKEIEIALEHVRSIHSEVTHVVFNREGQWMYFGDNFKAPKFDNNIDIGILEEASDSIQTLPSVFNIK